MIPIQCLEAQFNARGKGLVYYTVNPVQFPFKRLRNLVNHSVMIKRMIVILSLVWLSAVSAWAGDPFTVSGVKVDATGSNAIEAQTQAISEGQASAAHILLRRVTLPSERAGINLDAIGPESIARMIRALEISNEKRSTQRYLGEITVSFAPSEVQSFLASRNLTMMSSQAGERLIVPVLAGANLWQPNDWQRSWSAGGFENSLTPVKPVSLSQGNDSLISAAQASALDLPALKRLGNYFGARQVLVALAQPALGGIQVRMSDISIDSGEKRNLGSFTSPSYRDAAWAVMGRLEDDWKASSATLAENAVSMPVSILYRTHDDWIWLQSVINNSAQIQGARLDALSKDGALMSVTYGGDFDRLKNELSFKGVELRRDDNIGTVLFRKGRY